MKIYIICILSTILVHYSGYSQTRGLYHEMMLFSDIVNHVRTNYVEEADPSELMNAAIDGLLSSLDPHTVYLDPQRYNQFYSIMTGEMEGVGISFEIIDGYPTIISVVPGSPAEIARLRTGDIIINIDDRYITNMSDPEIHLLLGGKKGSAVKLTLVKFDSGEEVTVKVIRDTITISSVSQSYLLDKHTGYVRIENFIQSTANELQTSIRTLQEQGMKNLILDLRGNPGGSMQSAIAVLDLFLPHGKILLSTKGRKADANETFYSSEGKKQPIYPMIVLIDRGSASASELVAGALQEYDRALLIGTNSFGKGLVQGTFFLSNGGVILMTISRYFTPMKRVIQRDYSGKSYGEYYSEIFDTDSTNYTNRPEFKTAGGRTIYGGGGIIPDIFVESQSIEESADVEDVEQIIKDIQLRTALEYISMVHEILLWE